MKKFAQIFEFDREQEGRKWYRFTLNNTTFSKTYFHQNCDLKCRNYCEMKRYSFWDPKCDCNSISKERSLEYCQIAIWPWPSDQFQGWNYLLRFNLISNNFLINSLLITISSQQKRQFHVAESGKTPNIFFLKVSTNHLKLNMRFV